MVPKVTLNRRAFASGLSTLIACWPEASRADFWSIRRQWQPWKKCPSIAVVSTANDPRVIVAIDAVAFWNTVLSNIGSSFRLGPITRNTDPVLYNGLNRHADLWPLGDLRPTSNADAFDLNEILLAAGEDIVVLLSDRRGTSFSRNFSGLRKVFVVIAYDAYHIAARPDDSLNVIAQELGHAIALPYNYESRSLMCGVACDFRNPENEFLRLTQSDKATLLKMYPPSWLPEMSSK